MNQTLCERARHIQVHSGPPLMMCTKVINADAYPVNRNPLVPLQLTLPGESWWGKEETICHLKVFGRVSYILLDSVGKNKMLSNSKKCHFVDYNDVQMRYNFQVPKDLKILRSCKVIFNEKVLYEDRTTKTNGDTRDASIDYVVDANVELKVQRLVAFEVDR